MSRTFKLAIAAAVACIVLAPAAAADARVAAGAETLSVQVAYGDLNLSTQAGAQTLLKRISRAARKVCKDTSVLGPLNTGSQRDCRREAIGAAVAEVNAGTLTTAWNRSWNRKGLVQLSSR